MSTPGVRISCPTCGEPVPLPRVNRDFPFCGTKCKLVDLGRWMTGSYGLDPATGRLEVVEEEESDDIDEDDNSTRL